MFRISPSRELRPDKLFPSAHFNLTPNFLYRNAMNIKPVKTSADYKNALKEIDSLMRAETDTPDGEKLDVLVTLVNAWERKHFPVDLSDTVDTI